MNKALKTLQPYVGAADDEVVKRACLLLAHLLNGDAIPEELWTEEKRASRTHTWVPAMPRSLRQGDPVRIKHDAYPPESPLYRHNGQEGFVQAIRNGVIVGYKGAIGIGVRHETDKLERQVPLQPKTSRV